MIFVPSNDVMFRVNSNYNKYLGCLVGKKLEYNFDAILSAQDFDEINELRELMNNALSIDEIKKPNCYPLRRKLYSLCTRERVPLKVRRDVRENSFKSADGRQLSYSDSAQSYTQNSSDNNNSNHSSLNDDFLPLEVESNHSDGLHCIFPPIASVSPPLHQGIDYDSEEDERQALISDITEFESYAIGKEDEFIRTEPEVLCCECKSLVSCISNLKTITNPFNNGIAWRLTDPFGTVFNSDEEDELQTKKLRKVKSYLYISLIDYIFIDYIFFFFIILAYYFYCLCSKSYCWLE